MDIEYIVDIWKMQKLFEFIRNSEDLVEKRRENPVSDEIYRKSSEGLQKWLEMVFYAIMRITLPCMMWPVFIISFVTYFFTDLDGESFELPFEQWFPINWKTPFGYLIACALEYMGAVYSISIVLCQTTFIIASYWMLISLGKDITNELNTINAAQEDRLELTIKLSNVVHLHSNAKQLVRDFLNAYEFNILIHFFWTILTICETLLLIQMELSHTPTSLNMILTLVSEIFYCEFGERVSIGFDNSYNVICQFEWYSFPMDLKKMLSTIFNVAQQSHELRSFAICACAREPLKNVVNGGFSYFMMLREVVQ